MRLYERGHVCKVIFRLFPGLRFFFVFAFVFAAFFVATHLSSNKGVLMANNNPMRGSINMLMASAGGGGGSSARKPQPLTPGSPASMSSDDEGGDPPCSVVDPSIIFARAAYPSEMKEIAAAFLCMSMFHVLHGRFRMLRAFSHPLSRAGHARGGAGAGGTSGHFLGNPHASVKPSLVDSNQPAPKMRAFGGAKLNFGHDDNNSTCFVCAQRMRIDLTIAPLWISIPSDAHFHTSSHIIFALSRILFRGALSLP